MLGDSGKLLERIGRSVFRSAPEGWTTVTVKVLGLGSGADTEVTVDPAGPSPRTDLGLDTDGDVACLELRESMYAPDKGTWYVALITVQRSGQLDVEFDYDAKPFGDEEIDDDLRDMLVEDQELYPRPVERLPAWHPSRSGS